MVGFSAFFAEIVLSITWEDYSRKGSGTAITFIVLFVILVGGIGLTGFFYSKLREKRNEVIVITTKEAKKQKQGLPEHQKELVRVLREGNNGEKVDLSVSRAKTRMDIGEELTELEKRMAKNREKYSELQKKEKESSYITTGLRVKDAIAEGIKCGICKLDCSNQSREVVYCVHCEATFHKEHIEQWIRDKDYCPICRKRIRQKK